MFFYFKELYVCNVQEFGYVTNKESDSLSDSFAYLRMEHLLVGKNGTFNKPLPVTKYLEESSTKRRRTKHGFNQIFVINLERRPDRKDRIESALNDLNLAFKTVKAVDARSIDKEYIKNLGISVIPDYKDPYSNRSMNYGEIACFLSHYFIWKEVSIIFEKNICDCSMIARFD